MGKGLNPADQFRKEEKKKAFMKTKKKQEKVKSIQALLNDPKKINDEIQKLQKESDENRLDKSIKDKIKELESMRVVALKKEKLKNDTLKARESFTASNMNQDDSLPLSSSSSSSSSASTTNTIVKQSKDVRITTAPFTQPSISSFQSSVSGIRTPQFGGFAGIPPPPPRPTSFGGVSGIPLPPPRPSYPFATLGNYNAPNLSVPQHVSPINYQDAVPTSVNNIPPTNAQTAQLTIPTIAMQIDPKLVNSINEGTNYYQVPVSEPTVTASTSITKSSYMTPAANIMDIMNRRRNITSNSTDMAPAVMLPSHTSSYASSETNMIPSDSSSSFPNAEVSVNNQSFKDSSKNNLNSLLPGLVDYDDDDDDDNDDDADNKYDNNTKDQLLSHEGHTISSDHFNAAADTSTYVSNMPYSTSNGVNSQYEIDSQKEVPSTTTTTCISTSNPLASVKVSKELRAFIPSSLRLKTNQFNPINASKTLPNTTENRNKKLHDSSSENPFTSPQLNLNIATATNNVCVDYPNSVDDAYNEFLNEINKLT